MEETTDEIDITKFYQNEDEFLNQQRTKRTITLKTEDRNSRSNSCILNEAQSENVASENNVDIRRASESQGIEKKKTKEKAKIIAKKAFIMSSQDDPSSSNDEDFDMTAVETKETEGEYLDPEDYHLSKVRKKSTEESVSEQPKHTNSNENALNPEDSLKNPEDYYIDKKRSLLVEARKRKEEFEDSNNPPGIEQIKKLTENYLKGKSTNEKEERGTKEMLSPEVEKEKLSYIEVEREKERERKKIHQTALNHTKKAENNKYEDYLSKSIEIPKANNDFRLKIEDYSEDEEITRDVFGRGDLGKSVNLSLLNERRMSLTSSLQTDYSKDKLRSSRGKSLAMGSKDSPSRDSFFCEHLIQERTNEEKKVNKLDLIDSVEEKEEHELVELFQGKFVLKNYPYDQKKYDENVFEMKCITNLPEDSKPSCVYGNKDYLLVGFSAGFLCIFEIRNKFRVQKIPNKSSFIENEPITTLDISHDSEVVAIGFKDGSIYILERETEKVLYYQKPKGKFPSVMSMRFLFVSNDLSSKKKAHVIVSEYSGALKLIMYNNKFMNTRSEKTIMGEGENQYYQIECVVFNNSQSKLLGFIGLVSLKKIIILKYDSNLSFTRLHKFDKPEFINEAHPPSISWTIYKQDGILEGPKMLITWDNFLLIMIPNSKSFEKWDVIRFMILHEPLIYSTFVSENMIFSFDEDKSAFLLSLNEFSQGPFEMENIKLKSQRITPHKGLFKLDRKKLVDSIILKDSRKMVVSSFLNSFFPVANMTTVFILNESNLSKVYINSWMSFLDKMHNLGEHSFTMKTCILIYKGIIKELPMIEESKDERRKQMVESIRRIAIQYLTNSLRVCKNNPEETDMVSNTIMSLIEFLVECEDIEFIFDEVWSVLYQHRHEDIFFECLEPFIIMRRIRVWKEIIFEKVCAYYLKHNKLPLLERLVLGLDLTLTSEEYGEVMNYCLRYKLIKGLIYLNTEKEEFQIPLIQIFSYYEESKRKKEVKKPKRFLGNLFNEEGAQKYGYSCLWYLRMTLQGMFITKKKIPDDVYRIAVVQLAGWVFHEDIILLELISIDPDITFGILFLFFKPKCVQIIKSEGKNIRVKRIHEKEKSISIFSSQEYQNLNEMIELIFFCEKQLLIRPDYSDRKKGQFYLFVAKLIEMNQFDISTTKKIEVVIFLLRNPYVVDHLEFDKGLSEEEIEMKKNLFLEKIIISCGKEIKKDEKVFETLLNAAETSPFPRISCYLNTKKRDLARCIEIYLLNKNQNFKLQVYDWLDDVFSKIKRKKNEEKKIAFEKRLESTILQFLKELVFLDLDRLQNFLEKRIPGMEEKILGFLSPDTAIHSQYLKRVLIKREFGEKVRPEILLLYLESLCKDLNKKKEVLYELKNYEYPIEALNICKKYNVKQAMAFLLEKAGVIDEALSIYKDMFVRRLQKTINEIEKGKDAKTGIQKLNLKTKALEEIIKNNKHFGQAAHYEDLWFFYSDWILETHQTYVNSRREEDKFNLLLQFYVDTFVRIFEEILKDVSTNLVVEKIMKKYAFLKIGFVKNVFIKIVNNMEFEKNILSHSSKILKTTVIDYITEIISINTKGHELAYQCANCRSLLLNGLPKKLLVFQCNHMFHFECNNKSMCSICENDFSFKDNESKKKKNLIPTATRKIKNEYYDKKNIIKENAEFEEEDEGKANVKIDFKHLKVEERKKKLLRMKKLDAIVEARNLQNQKNEDLTLKIGFVLGTEDDE